MNRLPTGDKMINFCHISDLTKRSPSRDNKKHLSVQFDSRIKLNILQFMRRIALRIGVWGF